MSKKIDRELLERAVRALQGQSEPDEKLRVAAEIRECLRDPTPEPIAGQTTIYDHLTDSSSSQGATVPGHD